ncbi:unnamed protein product [Schistosoma mattheei]|uniref:PAP-associated domain-containing protein n=1 Tax=Schistosoma mattheei TaxID=31246 RepID=A0A183P081_9TREM|nr:unnamed protein product [Schistosoma mattheei]CAH8619167.1 unnamed protein product [Schistosoma haematobium]VDP41353.1 unnamed protein product [Schistosoma mattheei]
MGNLPRNKIDFYGHITDLDGVRGELKTVAAIKNRHEPILPDVVRSFLGLMDYYSRFAKNYAETDCLLMCLTEKNIESECPDIRHKPFDAMKDTIYSAPVLKLPNIGKFR